MSKEFIKKLEIELETRRRAPKQNNVTSTMGADLTGKDSRNVANEKVHSIDPNKNSSVYANRVGNTPSPNSSNNTAASHDIEKNMSMERLVQNIQNASKGTESKQTRSLPRSSVYFAQKLDQLEKINSEAEKITSEKIYDIDEVLERIMNM